MRTNFKERVWNEQYVFGDTEKDAIIDKMAAELGQSRFFAVLLYNRGYRTAEDAMRFYTLRRRIYTIRIFFVIWTRQQTEFLKQ